MAGEKCRMGMVGLGVMGRSLLLNMTSQAYFDSLRSSHLPVNLIQAQRDYFGSYTNERIDQRGVFHTRWSVEEEPDAG